jgi:DNA-binding GntR family transcriptional regulator
MAEGRLAAPGMVMIVTVDRGSAVPPYMQIAAQIRVRIESGEIQPGAALPSVSQIVGEYGVAKLTAQKALRLLVDEGLAKMVRGWGTFAVERPGQ